jgi:hypothetical protein
MTTDFEAGHPVDGFCKSNSEEAKLPFSSGERVSIRSAAGLFAASLSSRSPDTLGPSPMAGSVGAARAVFHSDKRVFRLAVAAARVASRMSLKNVKADEENPSKTPAS